MKSTLQEFENKLISKDDFIEDQKVKLEEKDKIIQSKKAEIEQLEKWTKMQDHKVKGKSHKPPGDCWFVNGLLLFWKVQHVFFQIGILQKTTKIYEDHKRSMKQELETREQRLQREVSDKKRMEQHMQRMVTATQLKWEKECVSQSSRNNKWKSSIFYCLLTVHTDPLHTVRIVLILPLRMQERRVNVMELEMQKKLKVKDDRLKQVKAILMESSIQPHQMQPEHQSSEEVSLSSAFSSPPSVRCVDAVRGEHMLSCFLFKYFLLTQMFNPKKF